MMPEQGKEHYEVSLFHTQDTHMKTFKHAAILLVTFLLGFYIISTSIITGKFFYDMYYADAFLIKIEPDRFVEAVAQSSYELQVNEGNKLVLRLKKGK